MNYTPFLQKLTVHILIPNAKYLEANEQNFIQSNKKFIEFKNEHFTCKDIIKKEINKDNCKVEIIVSIQLCLQNKHWYTK